MKVSTKGRYALSVMIDLAQHDGEGCISLKDIATRQDISMKYLESIVAMLTKAGLVDSARGKNGGYRLNRKLCQYNVGEILHLTEGSMAPVACLESGHEHCKKSTQCITFPMWQKLDRIVDDYLQSVTLADLICPGKSTEKCD